LVVAYKGALTDTEATSTAFPIFQYCTGFDKRGRGKVRYLRPRAQTIIQRLQPYNVKEPTSHPLWFLEKLNNIDKHRRLLITFLSPIGAGMRIPNGARRLFLQWSDEFALGEEKAEIARYRCVTIKDSRRVKMEFSPTLVVVFGDPPADERIVWTTLELIADHIRLFVIPNLRSELPD
jgi:hypothetical protein